jgi:hypothetical protein
MPAVDTDRNRGFDKIVLQHLSRNDGGETWTPIDPGMACNKIRIYKDANGKAYGLAIGVDVLKADF